MDSVIRLSKLFNKLNNICDRLISFHPREKLFGTRLIHQRLKSEIFGAEKKCRVAVIGLGGVGKSLAHLLKMYPAGITELRLCNRRDPTAIVEELSHIPTGVKVIGFGGPDSLADGLRNVEIVVLSAGIPRKENTSREELFLENAQLCKEIISCVADNCPEALIAIVTNPLDSLVPVAAEVLKQRGSYCAARLFGICELDSMRSRHFYSQAIGCRSSDSYVPVVGGHSEETTVPIFSQALPRVCLSDERIEELTTKVREAGKRVVMAKKGSGGSTFSMASAAFFFVDKLCRAINHEPHIIVSAYVESNVSQSRFFSNQLLLCPDGISKNFGYGEVTDFEYRLISEGVKILKKNIARAEKFVSQKQAKNVKL